MSNGESVTTAFTVADCNGDHVPDIAMNNHPTQDGGPFWSAPYTVWRSTLYAGDREEHVHLCLIDKEWVTEET